jgi:hypothetical protein
LTPLRSELLRGDRRVAYLAWLLAVQDGEVDGAAPEPPVPRGLAGGSAPLAALAEFLRLDQDLLAAAAESDDEDRDEPGDFRAWVKSLPAREWERWLLRAADNPDLRAAAAQASKPEEFDRRIAEVKQRYGRRRAFLDRLRRAETAAGDDAAERSVEVTP